MSEKAAQSEMAPLRAWLDSLSAWVTKRLLLIACLNPPKFSSRYFDLACFSARYVAVTSPIFLSPKRGGASMMSAPPQKNADFQDLNVYSRRRR
jgi:hypothetical protein